MIHEQMPIGLALIYIIGAYYIGRWAGRVGAETKRREEVATRLADEYEEAAQRK